jgi:hypothetical protein
MNSVQYTQRAMQLASASGGPASLLVELRNSKGGTLGRARHSRRRAKSKPQAQKRTFGGSVLILGHIRELALYRAEVLRAHGFHVATPRTEEEMKAAIRRDNFDVAVLSYTLPNDIVEEMAELMREYCRDCALVAITDTGRVDRKISPDEVVLADDGPGALIEALHRVTRSH